MVWLAWAAPPQAPIIDRLAGQWSGEGTVNGQRVRADAVFDVVLQGRFTRLQYRFVAGPATFEGHGYYTCEREKCRGQWFDSQGSQHLLSCVQEANSFTAEWSTGTTPRGRTEYKLASATTLVVTDWIRTPAGEWREFGRVEYKRVP
jgi:hypothetical protein